MIDVYFPKYNGSSQLRMPRTSPHVPDELGIRWHGTVLNGDQSVELCRRQAEAGAVRDRLAPSDQLENPDPVLRFHYRF